MVEKELRFMCAYTDCGKETTVIVKIAKPLTLTRFLGVSKQKCQAKESCEKLVIMEDE